MFGGVTLICVAALLPFWRPQKDAEPSNGVVLDVVLDTASNAPWHGEFVTHHRGVYDLVLAIGGTRDERTDRIWNCLLGAKPNSGDCGPTRPIVDLTWILWRGEPAESGSASTACSALDNADGRTGIAVDSAISDMDRRPVDRCIMRCRGYRRRTCYAAEAGPQAVSRTRMSPWRSVGRQIHLYSTRHSPVLT
jgi:hypothetical protein